jgi:hypothetical protein
MQGSLQYGRLRSHLTCLFRHVKQSSAAPLAAVRLLLFRGGAICTGFATELSTTVEGLDVAAMSETVDMN